jgi:hypothetical protein
VRDNLETLYDAVDEGALVTDPKSTRRFLRGIGEPTESRSSRG